MAKRPKRSNYGSAPFALVRQTTGKELGEGRHCESTGEGHRNGSSTWRPAPSVAKVTNRRTTARLKSFGVKHFCECETVSHHGSPRISGLRDVVGVSGTIRVRCRCEGEVGYTLKRI